MLSPRSKSKDVWMKIGCNIKIINFYMPQSFPQLNQSSLINLERRLINQQGLINDTYLVII